jgi:hypothetical protein
VLAQTQLERPPVSTSTRTLAERLRAGLRRPLVLAPAAAALVVAVTVGVAVSRPSASDDRLIAADPGRSAPLAQGDTAGAQAESLEAPPAAKTAGGATVRAQRISAWLALRVTDGDALAEATSDALRIVRSLDGYVVRSDVTAGDEGAATLSFRVPSARAQDAVARLSALGTIVGQRVVADDLQGEIDGLDSELVRLRAQLAAVRSRLASEELTPAERAALQARRDVLAARLAQARAQRGALAADAAEATVDVEIGTDAGAGVVAPPSRFDRTLGRALDLLAWEALVVLGLLVVLAPLALVTGGLLVLRRHLRHRDEERLLGIA